VPFELTGPPPGKFSRHSAHYFFSVKGSCSVADPDPYVVGPPGSGSESNSTRSGSESFYHQAKIVRKTLIHTVF
jgi:hypothetical protein